MREFVIIWILFFLVCLGLGYPSVKRFDPRTITGLSDTAKYHAIVTGEDQSMFRDRFRGRILVPCVAKPFYFAMRNRVPFDAGFVALLISTSIFSAFTCCLIVSLGTRTLGSPAIGLAGALLYLLNFAIPNLQLSGMIDSGEACLLAALTFSLLTNRWYLLPLWAAVGALAKETYVPIAFVFALVWWWSDAVERRVKLSRLKFVIAFAVVGVVTIQAVHFVLLDQFVWPWQIAQSEFVNRNLISSIGRILSSHELWYIFGWLLPLGVWQLKRFPKSWTKSVAAAATVAFILGVIADAAGNVWRALFDIAGPLLSLSVASYIARLLNSLERQTAIDHDE